ncbi:hypothetical protein G7Y89_g1392 [Cudoniella acicularis]|uniref:Ubiquitin interaction domain-containing protein n=1 Tax=Cudoniella acicularis TaxID=354080 RepID=A0A8H4RWH9_9HELO|nr:hypothetical protein G7Y89_g1392 [Cudoniella acicularis]
MAAYPQPSEEDIAAFLSLIGDVPRQEVIQRLKGNNCNVDQAVGEYFDYPDNTKYRWDDSQFNTDRDGALSNHGICPYQQFDGAGAPSRPPSRTSNNKSPLSKIIDMNDSYAAADPSTSKTFTGGDRDLEQALAASRAEAGLPPQESGITNTNEVYFGPATRTQYDQENWAMVPLGKSSIQEILLDPEPAERKRDIDVPAFLKPSVENHRLGALFTIYHEIPIVREIFLNRTQQLPNYGDDREWWAGKQIELAFIGQEESSEHQVNREIQRIMAFLDKTDRSYGSVEVLANLPSVKRAQLPNSDIEPAVLLTWRNVSEWENQRFINKMFSKGVPTEAAEDQTKEFAILELAFPPKDSMQDTLYDIADDALWPSLGPLDLAQSPYLSHIADVIAFKIEGDESNKNVEIPAVWYPDRYLKSGRQKALEMRLRKHDVEEELQRLQNLEEQLTNFQMRGGKTVKVKDLFKICLRHDEAQIQNNIQPRENEDTDLISLKSPGKAPNLSTELRKAFVRTDNRHFKAEFIENEDTQTQLSSPGKRKFDERSEEGSQDSTTGRWNGAVASPNMSIMEREMGGSDGPSWEGPQAASQSLASRLNDVTNETSSAESREVLVGVDPSLVSNNGVSSGQEMQERGSMPMVAARPLGNANSTIIESMDLVMKEVMEDDRLAEESPAVKHVGFTE